MSSRLKSGTVLEHMQRAIEFTRTQLGAHGLPLLGFADWNDTVNLRSRRRVAVHRQPVRQGPAGDDRPGPSTWATSEAAERYAGLL